MKKKLTESDVILGAWSRKQENSQGVTDAWVKFYLPDEEALNVLLTMFSEEDFRGNKKSGGRLMNIVLNEFDDLQETPFEYAERKQLLPSQVSALICKDELFPLFCKTFLKEILNQMKKEELFFSTDTTEDKSAKVIRYVCSIKSRSELDLNAGATYQFYTMIRKPFHAFKQQKVQQ